MPIAFGTLPCRAPNEILLPMFREFLQVNQLMTKTAEPRHTPIFHIVGFPVHGTLHLSFCISV